MGNACCEGGKSKEGQIDQSNSTKLDKPVLDHQPNTMYEKNETAEDSILIAYTSTDKKKIVKI